MEVLHSPEKALFTINANSRISRLGYTIENGIFDIRSTYVPDELRGKGIASMLVEAACEYAKEHNFKIVASCSYAVALIKRHPEYGATAGRNFTEDSCSI